MNDEATRQHLVKFIRRIMSGNFDDNAVYQLVNLGMRYELKECLPLARKLLEETKNNNYYQAQAMMAVATFGSVAEDSERLRKFIDSTQNCTTFGMNNKHYTTQVGDVALAAIIQLHRRHPKDFGFPNAGNLNGPSLQMHYLGFLDEDERKAARKKWEEYKALEDAGTPAPQDQPPRPKTAGK